MSLRPKSLDNFGPSGWWAIADALVDGEASASPSALTAAVRARAMDGDLRRADAWLADSGDDLDRGAALLTEKMVDDLADAGIVKQFVTGTAAWLGDGTGSGASTDGGAGEGGD